MIDLNKNVRVEWSHLSLIHHGNQKEEVICVRWNESRGQALTLLFHLLLCAAKWGRAGGG